MLSGWTYKVTLSLAVFHEGTRRSDDLVPVSRRSVKLFGERKDLFVQIALRDGGANESAVFDFRERVAPPCFERFEALQPAMSPCPSCYVHPILSDEYLLRIGRDEVQPTV